MVAVKFCLGGVQQYLQGMGRLGRSAYQVVEALGHLRQTNWRPGLSCAARRQLSVHFGPDADVLQEILARNLVRRSSVIFSKLKKWSSSATSPAQCWTCLRVTLVASFTYCCAFVLPVESR